MFPTRIAKRSIVVLLTVVIGIAGCNVDGHWARIRSPGGPVATGADRRDPAFKESAERLKADAQEVDLVEAVATHRSQYRQALEQLHEYYTRRGAVTKAQWAAFERKGLRGVKQFRYFLDAEIPSETLRPTEESPEADALYEQGVDLMRRGGHGMPALYREDRMVEAAAVLQELIENYPASDKIDDAAFLLGTIHEEYLPGQELIAANWYERAWTWNPETPHPARFHAASIYDHVLRNRDRALELYQSVVKHGTSDRRNVRRAIRRIHDLTSTRGAATSRGTTLANRTGASPSAGAALAGQ